jgi:hypothetical protein
MKEQRRGLENIISLNAFRIIIHSRAPVALFFSCTHTLGGLFTFNSIRRESAKREIPPFMPPMQNEKNKAALEVHFIASNSSHFLNSCPLERHEGRRKKIRSREFNYG